MAQGKEQVDMLKAELEPELHLNSRSIAVREVQGYRKGKPG